MKEKLEAKKKKKRYPQLRYSESLKRQACEEFLKGEKTARAVLDQYGIRFMGAIPYWLKQLGLDRSAIKPVLSRMKKKGHKSDLPAPERSKGHKSDLPAPERSVDGIGDGSAARIKELERRLEDSELKADAYLRIIEFAEQELKIPIRKKPNTK